MARNTTGLSNTQLDAVPKEKSQMITNNLMELNKMGKPETNSELIDRIEQYFEFCSRSSMRPGVESMCLALHISRTTLFRWANGEDCDPERQKIIVNAKQMLAAYLEQASLSGAINPVSSIFLMKNWLSYKDVISFEESVSATEDKKPINLTNEQLAARLGGRIDSISLNEIGGDNS